MCSRYKGKERSDEKVQSISSLVVVREDCCAEHGIIEGSALQNEKHTGTCPELNLSPGSTIPTAGPD